MKRVGPETTATAAVGAAAVSRPAHIKQAEERGQDLQRFAGLAQGLLWANRPFFVSFLSLLGMGIFCISGFVINCVTMFSSHFSVL